MLRRFAVDINYTRREFAKIPFSMEICSLPAYNVLWFESCTKRMNVFPGLCVI